MLSTAQIHSGSEEVEKMAGGIRARFGLQGQPCDPRKKRVVARWTDAELRKIDTAVYDGLDLDETWALFPHRSRHSVKDRYYKAREPQDRDDPASLADARRQKDAIEGSAKLKDAIVRAGLYVPPEMKKAG
jgi:hypothetical protein